jgi:hypothetical protein
MTIMTCLITATSRFAKSARGFFDQEITMGYLDGVKAIIWEDNQRADYLGNDELGPLWKLSSATGDPIETFHSFNDLLNYRANHK